MFTKLSNNKLLFQQPKHLFSYSMFSSSSSQQLLTQKKIGNHIYLAPPADVQHKNTLIWMHGLGDCANSFVDIFINPGKTSPFPLSTKIILLNAPQMAVTLNFGMVMNSWYDITAIGYDLKDRYSKEDVKKNSEAVREIMEKEITENLKGDPSKIWIGGFSQGGCMALNVGLEYQKNIGGILSCSCALFDMTNISNEQDKSQNIPIFAYHGEGDMMIPMGLSVKSYERIKHFKNFSFESEKGMGHQLNLTELEKMKAFVAKHLV